MAIFVYVKQPSEKTLYIKLGTKHVIIGRSTSCDLVVKDPLISGRHCSLYLTNKVATIKDIGSTNGTIVNDSHVSEVNFFLGDVVKIGSIEMSLIRDQMTPEEIACHSKSRNQNRFINVLKSGVEKKRVPIKSIYEKVDGHKEPDEPSAVFSTSKKEKSRIMKKDDLFDDDSDILNKSDTGIINKIAKLFKKEEER